LVRRTAQPLNHIGLWIRNYADVKAKVVAARLEIVADSYNETGCAASPGTPACQFTVTFPDGVMIEFTEDRKLATAAASHHIHMRVTEPEAIRGWYLKTFGGTPYLRRGVIVAAMLDAGKVDFSNAGEPQAATKGRGIDELGLEVQGLEAFCKKLDAQGVRFETAYHRVFGGRFSSAFITDPVGTRIQLAEGLALP
jgi:catechol 2,3-dioxygenase-like lactoylglutathione lyase family enzyme